MSPQPLELNDVLSRFRAKTHANNYGLYQQILALIQDRKLLEALNRARTALSDGTNNNDRNAQAIACAYLAAAYASQENFTEAVRQANDCYRLFKQIGSKHNAAVAKALLATIYQMHLDMLSRELVRPLREGQDQLEDIETKALSKGQVDEAKKLRQQFIEFGEQIRRARWIQAIPYALPLVWLPVINTIPSDPDTQGAEPVGYMEPILFVLKSKQDVTNEESPGTDPGQIVDELYTARPLPPIDTSTPAPLRPPRLRPNARYAAIKVDPDSASIAGLDPEDYLLVRSLSSAERAELLKQAGENFIGCYFQVDRSGKVEVVNAIPPKFVGEEDVRMLVAQVDAVLRRVS